MHVINVIISFMTFILISSSLHYTSVLANDATTTTTTSINHVTPGASANKQKEIRIKMKNQIKAGEETKLLKSNINKLKNDCNIWRISVGKCINGINGMVKLKYNVCFANMENPV